MKHLIVFLIFAFFVNFCQSQFAEGIGYIGPACAVVDGNLYIHGILVRPLNESEIIQFELYQDGLAKLKKLQSSPPAEHKKIEMPPPIIPAFCVGMSDNTEVVLKGCIVRDNRVFIKGKLIRPLNSLERDTVAKMMTARAAAPPQTLFFQRKKRSTTVEKTQNDVAELLEQFLKVNATVAKRFLPVAKMSPLLNELSQEAVKAAENEDETHRRETRTTPEEQFKNLNFNSQPFQMPTFAYSGYVPEQPFQQQLPELTPFPTFNQQNGAINEPDPFFGANAFHSFPTSQIEENPFFGGNQNPETVPIMVNPESQTSAYLFTGNDGNPIEIRGNIRPGDRMMIGGKNYVAVTMNQLTPNQLSQLGNVLGNYQPGVVQSLSNYGSFVGTSNLPVQETWQPNNFMPFQAAAAPTSPFGQNFASQPKLRFHPGKNIETVSAIPTPTVSQEVLNAGMAIINQMPHQICTAHIANPFWFLQK